MSNTTLEQPIERIVVWGYTVELYEDEIYIYDPDKKLDRTGTRKIADWIVAEGFKMVPFEVKVFQKKAE